jgi:oxalate decarboxylase
VVEDPLSAGENAPLWRSTRRQALRLLGAGAGAGVIGAAGPTRVAAQAATATPTHAAGTTQPPAPEPLFFRLGASTPVTFASGASVQFARGKDFPALTGLSLATFEINQHWTREMHWHNNASELGWCLDGAGRMVLMDEWGGPVFFNLEPGSVFFAPKGWAHAFWPTTDQPLRMLLSFDNPTPATIDFSQMMPTIPSAVVAQSAGVPRSQVPTFPTVPHPFLAPLQAMTRDLIAAEDDPEAERFTLRMGDISQEPGDDARTGAAIAMIPTLVGIKTTLMTLASGTDSEPHWHPLMNELVFVLNGEVEVGIVGTNAASQISTLAPMDLAFVPMNWLHYISNRGDKPARVLLFHDATSSLAVSLSQVLKGFPPEVLAASYGLDPQLMDTLASGDPPRYPGLPA